MAKYKAEINDVVFDWVSKHGLLDFGGAQLQDFVRMLGVDDKTYRRWLYRYADFKNAIERGKSIFKQNLTFELHTSLASAAMGGEHEETTTEYRPNPNEPDKPTLTKMVKRKTYTPPNVGAAIFLLTNLDPEHYKNRQKNDVALRVEDEDNMTIEEINAEIERLEKFDFKPIE